ncbi:hypothetical protein QBC42DRAFT_279504 [Cladorrhinum samala]|uniref:Uncharacterized protein n=1 Tax=Cladorrhinum samala TaxID=585594 RepID=A0AAV9HDV3_9PEZI|nr:hypothetical protein QBC42DRAFT_279504 [Cladorrhinum samala]
MISTPLRQYATLTFRLVFFASRFPPFRIIHFKNALVPLHDHHSATRLATLLYTMSQSIILAWPLVTLHTHTKKHRTTQKKTHASS